MIAEAIQDALTRLPDEYGATPVMGAELEFFCKLSGLDELNTQKVLKEFLLQRGQESGISFTHISPERGREQYEASLSPTRSLIKLADSVVQCKDWLVDLISEHHGALSLDPKPFANDYGNAMQFTISLLDGSGKSLLHKREAELSDTLRFSLGGLLETMPALMPVFAPNEDAYVRFVPNMLAPTTVSWGGNNRTTALRLPDSPPEEKRIEHRVAGMNACPYRVILAILLGIQHGLEHRIDPGPQIFGNAADAQYALPPLPVSLDTAQECFQNSPFAASWPEKISKNA